MAKDVGDAIGAAIGHAAREVVETVSANARKGSKRTPQLSGGRGMAAGAGLVALVPLAAKGGQLALHGLRNGTSAAGDKVSDTVSDAVGRKVGEAGGAGGIAKEAGKALLPFGGGKKSGGGGVGHGRRMPIQQAVDVAVPIGDAYEQWTNYEEWPKFMHRLDRVSQEDDTHISFKTKIWGISREFKAEIIDETPEERVKWRVTDGVSHTGVVTFHELGPRLTRVDVDIDVHPGSLIEKLGRGLRHAKRAVRADLHRFKAHVEIEEEAPEGDEQEQRDEKPTRAASRSSSRTRSASAGRRRSSGTSRTSGGGSGGNGRRGSNGSRTAGAGRGSAGRSAARGSGGGSNGASASSGGSSRSRSSSPNGASAARSGGSRPRSSGSSSRRKSTTSSR